MAKKNTQGDPVPTDQSTKSKLHPGPLAVISFGLAFGVTCGIFAIFLGIMSTLFEWGIPLTIILSSLFIGFGPSFVGVVAGAVWAFVFGFIVGMLIAWLYNIFLVKRRILPM